MMYGINHRKKWGAWDHMPSSGRDSIDTGPGLWRWEKVESTGLALTWCVLRGKKAWPPTKPRLLKSLLLPARSVDTDFLPLCLHSWFLFGGALLFVSLSIAFYCIVYLEWYCGIEEYDVKYPTLVPITTATFIAAGIW